MRVKEDYIEVSLTENPDKNAIERWDWDLNQIENPNLENYFQTIN